jgi:hypothetical protein
MTLTSGGNLGIGTSSPARKLDVNGSIRLGDAQALEWGGTAYAIVGDTGGALLFKTASAERARIDSSGNFGIGTTNPLQKLVVSNGGAEGLEISPTAIASGSALISYNRSGAAYTQLTTSALRHVWQNSGTEVARIDSSGNFLVSTTSTAPRDFTTGSGGTKIPVAGGALEHATTNANCMFINRIGSGAITSLIDFRQNASSIGSISYNGTLVVYNTTSDYRLKTVVGAVTGHGARIDALEPIEYTWNSNGSRTRGFLAHKFQEVYADSVTGAKDAVDADGKPIYQAMQASSSEVIADLVAEIQSLRKRLADAGL